MIRPGGTGRGRSFRSMAFPACLRNRGYGVRNCGGVTASSIWSFRGVTACPALSLRHVVPGSAKEGVWAPFGGLPGYRGLLQIAVRLVDRIAGCHTAICRAGFKLKRAAMCSGKSLLAAIARRAAGQPLDALFPKRDGPNRAVVGRPVTCRDVRVFHRRLDGFFDRLRVRNLRGNKEALSSIEELITRAGPTVQGRPASPAAPSLTRAMASYR